MRLLRNTKFKIDRKSDLEAVETKLAELDCYYDSILGSHPFLFLNSSGTVRHTTDTNFFKVHNFKEITVKQLLSTSITQEELEPIAT